MHTPRGFHRMPSGELMSNHVKHYQPADPRQQVGNGWLGSIGDAALGASTTVGGIAGLSAATGIGVPAAVAEGTLAAGLGATGAVLKGADRIVDALRGSGDCGCHQCEQDGTGLADELADFADALASTADALLETAPEKRRKRKRSESPKRKGLQRIDRSSVSSRKRTAATDVPSAPRRRGENRSASSYNRPRSYMTTPLPQNADVVDLT